MTALVSRRILLATLLATSLPAVRAQSPAPAKLPRFDVTTIKPSKEGPGEINGFYTYPGGRVVCHGCTVHYLIMIAFDVQIYQVVNGPEWTNIGRGDRFELEARPPAASASIHSNPAIPKNPPNDEQRQMMQALLMDRFGLQFHRDSRDGMIYILTRGDKPLKLSPPKDPNAYSWAGGPQGGAVGFGTGLAGTNISMPQLAVRLGGVVRRPVLDHTNLQGSFDFVFRTGIDDRDADPTVTVIDSLKELGLKLEKGTGPIETIVIDHIEKPTPN